MSESDFFLRLVMIAKTAVPRTKPLTKRERDICARLIEFRSSQGWSRAEVARMTGLNQFTLAAIENGRSRLSFSTGYDLCRMLNISLQWLATGVPPRLPFTPILSRIIEQIPIPSVFSQAYDHYLKQAVATRLSQLADAVGCDVRELESVGDLRDFHRTGGSKSEGDLDQVFAAVRERAEGMNDVEKAKLSRRLIDVLYSFWTDQATVVQSPEKMYPKDLTETSESPSIIGEVKISSQWPALKKRLQKATEGIGVKPALAKILNVDATQISQWLSESKSAREPGGDYALRLLKWVEQQERQVK